MRSEKWSSPEDIKYTLGAMDSPGHGAGPVLFSDRRRFYSDDSEAMIMVQGRTGQGKTQCCVLPFLRDVIQKRESAVIVDPKGDLYRGCGGAISDDCQTFVLDFRNEDTSPDHWNPLTIAYRLSKSPDPAERDIAAKMVYSLFEALYPNDPHLPDPFWNLAAQSFAVGLTHSLFLLAHSEKEVNLNSVASMMELADESLGGTSLHYINILYNSLPKGSLAKRYLATYISAPVKETRPSIQAVAAAGMQLFVRSEGIVRLLGDDTINFIDIDLSRQFMIFLILPDETNIYSEICGFFVQAFYQHLVRSAYKMNGRLPRRVNFILEELGNIGKAIGDLPNMCTEGRSRNIRLMLVLQAYTQLYSIFGEARSETIRSSMGVSINFAAGNLQTVNELSQRLGIRETTDESGRTVKEALLSPTQISSMPKFTAVILANGLKYVERLPLYSELYGSAPAEPVCRQRKPSKTEPALFDFERTVTLIRENKINEILTLMSKNNIPDTKRGVETLAPPPAPEAPLKKKPAGNKPASKKTPPKKFIVNVSVRPDSDEKRRNNVSELVAAAMDISVQAATDKLKSSRPVQITFYEEAEALFFAKLVLASGGVSEMRNE